MSFWCLVLFSVLLLPGFLQMVVFYFVSPRVLRSIPYGLQVRCCQALLLPGVL